MDVSWGWVLIIVVGAVLIVWVVAEFIEAERDAERMRRQWLRAMRGERSDDDER
jgi:hypothetical protein